MNVLHGRFTTQAEIDAEYNVGAAVANYHDHVDRWLATSAEARRDMRCSLQVPYGPTLAERLDIFPADAPGAPVLVFFHGGYWRSLAAADFSFIARGLHALGFTTVMVDYALCPWVTIDEIVRQARASIAWVHGHIAGHGGDPGRVVIAGHSAGGHLAAMALLTRWREVYGIDTGFIRGVLPISGIHDLAPLRFSYLQPMLQLDDGTIARNSPIRHVAPRSAPTCLVWGDDEPTEFARQSIAMAEALRARGNVVESHALPGANHFTVLDGFLDAESTICRWLKRVIG